MPNRSIGRILILVLIVAVVASWILTFKTERDKRRLASALEQAQASVDALEQERLQLSGDLAQVSETLTGRDSQLESIQAELNGLKDQLHDAVQEIARLQTEQSGMYVRQASLTEQLDTANLDRDAMRAKLSSIKELKAAILTVKHHLREQRHQVWLAKAEAQRAEDQQRLAQGNRGFVVRDGSSTLAVAPRLGTKLQVRVLEPQSE